MGQTGKMRQKSRIPSLPECHRMSQNVTESCILWQNNVTESIECPILTKMGQVQRKCHRMGVSDVDSEIQKGIPCCFLTWFKRNALDPKGKTRPLWNLTGIPKALYSNYCILCAFQSRIPYCDFHDCTRDSYQNAPKVKNMWYFLRKMEQDLKM